MPDQLALGGVDTSVPHSEDLEQWFTPPPVAQRFVRWALRGVPPGSWVLEPGAGSGALVSVALELGYRVVAVEIDRHWADALRAAFPDGERVRVLCADFLAVDYVELLEAGPKVRGQFFGAAFLNPAFAIACPVLERCLRVAPRASSLLPASVKHSADRAPFWARHAYVREAVFADRPRFIGPKNIGAATDFLALDVVALTLHEVSGEVPRPPCQTEAPWRL